MKPEPTPAEVRDWAQTVLRQLGDPEGCTLSVRPRQSASGGELPPDGPPFTSRLETYEALDAYQAPDTYEAGGGSDSGADHGSGALVTLTFADGSSTAVLLEGTLTRPEAVLKLAEQLQEAVLEQTAGAALPPCPATARHQHPATPQSVSGTPSWACPAASGEARTRPILPGGDGPG